MQNDLEIIGITGRLWSNEWLGRDFADDLHLELAGDVTTVSLPRVNVCIPQIEHSSQCVLDGTVPIIGGEHGRDNVAVVEAAVSTARALRTLSVRRVEGS